MRESDRSHCRLTHRYPFRRRSLMTYLRLKAALSAILIAIISEVARRYRSFGGLVTSLAHIALLAIIWLGRDAGVDVAQVAGRVGMTFYQGQ